MSRFRFKFTTLLQYKKVHGEKKKRELAEVAGKENWFGERLLSLEKEIEKSQGELSSLRLQRDLQKQLEMMSYIETLQETLKALREAKEEVKQLRIVKEEEHKTLKAERKVIENLRESHYTDFRLHQQRKEENHIEESRSSPRP